MPSRPFFLPCYTHPCQIVEIDDDRAYTESVEDQMDPLLSIRSFQDSVEASAWLHDFYARVPHGELPVKASTLAQTGAAAEEATSINIESVFLKVLDSQRFLTPAVLVVEFDIAGKDGIAFCEGLGNLPCKKILFSAQVRRAEAGLAMRAKIIDDYSLKSANFALNKLEVDVARLQKKFFIEQTAAVKDLLANPAYSFMTDREFSLVVQDVCVGEGYIEHYVLADPPGLLLVDRYGATKIMVIETEAGLRRHAETVRTMGGDPELQAALQDKAIVPFFWQGGGHYNDQSTDWQHYTSAAKLSQFNEAYYWALFDVPTKYLAQPVYCFEQFQNENRKARDARKKIGS